MKNIHYIGLSLFITITFLSCQSFSSLNTSRTVKWVSMEKVVDKKSIKKMVFVEVYTSWCGWCKRMESSTFNDPKIAQYLNTYFYSVKFDAEDREEIDFKGKVYKYNQTGRRGRHELATHFMQGNEKVGYPTLVFLDENLEIIQAVPGYRSTEEFEVIVTYFAEGHYKTTPWVEYEANYTPMSMK